MKKLVSYVCLTLIFVVGCENRGLQVACKSKFPAIPEIIVPYVEETAPVIDGRLDDDVWKSSAKIKLLVNNGSQAGLEPVRATIVKLVWDKKNLYLGFKCFDRNIHSKFTNRDDKLWNAGYDEIEVAEMMLCEGNNIRHYFEFNFNPRGVLFDTEIKWRNGESYFNPAYNSNVRWATNVEGSLNNSDDEDKYWTVEIAVPWADIGMRAPDSGQTMRANFYRSDNSEQIHFSAWSPTYKSYFHIPERFGRLIFVKGE